MTYVLHYSFLPFFLLNPITPNRYSCTYVLFSFLRSNCCKKQTLTLLTHKSPKHTIVSIEIKPFPLQIKPLKVNSKLNWRIFIFCALGTNGLRSPHTDIRLAYGCHLPFLTHDRCSPEFDSYDCHPGRDPHKISWQWGCQFKTLVS